MILERRLRREIARLVDDLQFAKDAAAGQERHVAEISEDARAASAAETLCVHPNAPAQCRPTRPKEGPDGLI